MLKLITHKFTNIFLTTKFFYTMTHFSKILDEIKLYEPTLKTYRVMYYFGAWLTHKTITAENDAEAIHDADEIMQKAPAKDKLTYALWDGNRKVKVYEL